MNVIREIQRINDAELKGGIVGTPASWHTQYANSAWVFVGNLPMNLTEGDVICILSQYGEIEDINLVREESTGKSRGFAFVKYEDARSCILAVDNLTGSKILNRSIRVDHVEKYRLPKELLEKEGVAKEPVDQGPGHAYRNKELSNEFSLQQGQDLFAAPAAASSLLNNSGDQHDDNEHKEADHDDDEQQQAKRQRKEERQRRRQERETRRQERGDRKRQKRAKRLRRANDDGSDMDAYPKATRVPGGERSHEKFRRRKKSRNV